MQLHGSTEGNLISAIRSAISFRGRPVHADTLTYWGDLLRHARSELTSCSALPPEGLGSLVEKLELEIIRRPR